MADETITEDLFHCEELIRHLEVAGEEVYERVYKKDGVVRAAVIAVVGDAAEELVALIREWATQRGMKNTPSR